MTFKTGDKVRVTPEYAAWYKAKTGNDTSVTPETALTVHSLIQDDGEAIVLDRSPEFIVPVLRIVPLEYLVSAEEVTN